MQKYLSIFIIYTYPDQISNRKSGKRRGDEQNGNREKKIRPNERQKGKHIKLTHATTHRIEAPAFSYIWRI